MHKRRRKSRKVTLNEELNKHAKKHGRYIRQRVDKDGPKVARNILIVPLVDCFERGQITWGMYNAGLFFERIVNQYRRVIDAPTGGRDSCDFSVRGNSDETSVERGMRIKAEYLDARHVLTVREFLVLDEIVVQHQKTGDRRDKYKRWSEFTDGLKSLQKHWKIAENERE